MKEGISKGLIDEDESEGDEPDLIANHPVGDMVDRDFKEVSEGQMPIKANPEIKVNCVMNHMYLHMHNQLLFRLTRILNRDIFP